MTCERSIPISIISTPRKTLVKGNRAVHQGDRGNAGGSRCRELQPNRSSSQLTSRDRNPSCFRSLACAKRKILLGFERLAILLGILPLKQPRTPPCKVAPSLQLHSQLTGGAAGPHAFLQPLRGVLEIGKESFPLADVSGCVARSLAGCAAGLLTFAFNICVISILVSHCNLSAATAKLATVLQGIILT